MGKNFIDIMVSFCEELELYGYDAPKSITIDQITMDKVKLEFGSKSDIVAMQCTSKSNIKITKE